MASDRRKCCVLTCLNGGRVVGSDFHLYGLPKTIELRDKWRKWIGNENKWDTIPSKNLYVCSEHFREEDKGLKKLKSGAVPCISTAKHDVDPELVQSDAYSEYSCVIEVDMTSHLGEIVDSVECLIIESNDQHFLSSYDPNIFQFEEVFDVDEPCSSKGSTNYRTQIVQILDSNTVPEVGQALNHAYVEAPNSACSQSYTDCSSNGKEVASGLPSLVLVQETQVSQATKDAPLVADNFACYHNYTEHSLEENELVSSLPTLTLKENATKKSANKKQSKLCSAKGCINPGDRFFTFPAFVANNIVSDTNVIRFKKWVKNSGNPELLQPPNSLHKRQYLCTKHFNDDQFYNKSRITLLPNAVPTVFDFPSLTDEEISSSFQLQESIFNGQQNTTNEDMPNLSNNDNPQHVPQSFIPDECQKRFESFMDSLEWRYCPKCREKFFVPKKSSSKCIHGKSTCVHYTSLNDMDPGDVPPELSDLTYVEEQLIARVHPIVTVFKLRGHQLGYSGNVINFPQNITSFAKQLPHRLSDLSSVITVRTTTSEVKPVDFQVRADRVRNALSWLIENNPFYSDVELSYENMKELPGDANVYDQITTIQVNGEESVDDAPVSNNFNLQTTSTVDTGDNKGADDDYGDQLDEAEDYTKIMNVVESAVPMVGLPSENAQIGSVLEWPTINPEPINELSTPGYIVQAFPTLFPYGKADLRSAREEKVTPLNYFKHLLRYHDGRFAKHPRFRYFALNSYMRWSALKDGNLYVSLNSEFKDMTIVQLKEELKNNPNLIRKIMFQSSNIRGTKSFWYARGKELLTMIEQLDLPSLFFTLSAADFHWPDLYKLLVPGEDPNTIAEVRRRKLIEENPLICDAFFFERAESFIKIVLKDKFKIKDYWFRVEYQHRGSPHIHGVLWIDGAPDVKNLNVASEEEKQKVIDFFDEMLSTMHPNINEIPAPVHPSRLKLSEVNDAERDLSQLLNKVQRHTRCTDGYCLKKNKKTGKKECRFGFPHTMQAVSTIVVSPETKNVELVTARNDPRLNKYNAFIIQTWRANIDVSAVLSKQALVNYLAKYISKPERESKTMADVLKLLLEKTDESKHARTLLQRLYIQCCAERDFSAQEACHLLMGFKLVSTGDRNFVIINFSSYAKWVKIAANSTNKTKTTIQRYVERDDIYEEQCLWYMVKTFNMNTGRKYKKEAIVQIFPKLRFNTNPLHSNEDYYRQQVLLYMPWRIEYDLLCTGNMWKEVYEKNITVINQNRSEECNLENVVPDEAEFEVTEEDDDYYSSEEWMCLSKMGPSQNVQQVELGRREVDVNYDWHHALLQYEKYGGLNALMSFISQKKQCDECELSEVPYPDVSFTKEQKCILNLLDLQIQSLQLTSYATDFLLPKRIIVQGRAGTGKSLVIQAMKHKIQAAFGNKAFLLLTPTGVSAKAIDGHTIHSKLHINTKSKEFVPLKGAAAHKLEEELLSAKFLLIDEFSMIGNQLMHMIEERIKQGKGDQSDDFGNLFVYIFGDVKQLPPIGDSPVYSDHQISHEHIRGKLVYENFHGAVVLHQIQRQNDKEFQTVLNNISEGCVSTFDYDILKKRFSNAVSQSERKAFKDAVHLYPTRLQVLQHNKERLMNLKDGNGLPVPIARIPGMHNCKAASQGTRDDAEGLFPIIHLSEGVRIMLKSNLWTEKGLVNGAMGEIVHILYNESSSPQNDPPDVLICKFDSYKGPYLDNELKTVPIIPMTKSWTSKTGEMCSRTQFPVTLCFACSIHQSQGLTMEKAFIDIGNKEMSPGISYVGLSRVKTLQGILLEPFPFKRLQRLNSKDAVQRRKKWAEDLMQMSITDAFSD